MLTMRDQTYDILWVARSMMILSSALLALAGGLYLGGARPLFVVVAFAVPGAAGLAGATACALIVWVKERRWSREVDVVDLKARETDKDRSFLNVDAWLREVDPED